MLTRVGEETLSMAEMANGSMLNGLYVMQPIYKPEACWLW
jgi:hypothetical protein